MKKMMKTSLFLLMPVSCIMLMAASCEDKERDHRDEVDYYRPPEAEFVLAFEDNFDGTAVNEEHWGMYDGPGHDNNGLRKPSAFSVEDGNLVITAQMVDGQIVSGGMANSLSLQYGKFEARVRADDDPSLATSAVFLTWPTSGRWPIDGENNIYETGTNRRESFWSFVHYGADNRQEWHEHKINAKEWHVVAMEWEPNRIRIFVDGKLEWTVTNPAALPHNPHHACLQLDAFAETMGDPVKMYVDWIKVYERVEKE